MTLKLHGKECNTNYCSCHTINKTEQNKYQGLTIDHPVASAREQMKRRNTYYVHAMLSPLKGYLLYLGKANLTPEEVVSVAPRQVLNFYGSLELP